MRPGKTLLNEPGRRVQRAGRTSHSERGEAAADPTARFGQACSMQTWGRTPVFSLACRARWRHPHEIPGGPGRQDGTGAVLLALGLTAQHPLVAPATRRPLSLRRSQQAGPEHQRLALQPAFVLLRRHSCPIALSSLALSPCRHALPFVCS